MINDLSGMRLTVFQDDYTSYPLRINDKTSPLI